MTVVAVVAEPPREGLVLPELAETTPLSGEEAADLYAAAYKDVVSAVADSGGDLLVNYRSDVDLPEKHHGEQSAEEELRALARDALDGADDTRFEVQVGTTRSARVGNTITHLLDREEATSAAAISPTAPLLARTHVDGAAMKLRNNPVVLGPTPDGDVYYAGFADTIDFQGAYEPPAVETMATRAVDAGHAVEYTEMLPTIDTAAGLRSLVSLVRSRVTAGRIVPEFTAMQIDDLGLRVEDDDGPTLVRE
ncbi:hypothetical protein SAMN06269185_0486 [Natronoarchaeum philippinense]|uniref:DUF2064 domain-containing protein n=1 Tax=Natronoarchaeum philippinense TaxID=558529 RepID=A0A285N425_NATPI|nr:hypothetical protein [Natronoarchaeum philippinense]SNZ04212.1 hypothetical protein SAMN06269185_0486 [Natronoarchaeum philippinense]